MNAPRLILFLSCLAFSVATAVPLRAQQKDQKAVLVIWATRREAPAPLTGDRTFVKLLSEGLGGKLDYYSEFIDVARFPDAEYQVTLHRLLQQKYKSLQIDLVIGTSNTANDFINKHRQELFPTAAAVFVGAPGFVPGANSTGVGVPLKMSGTLETILQLQPETKRVFVVSGAAEYDKYYEALAREQFRRFEDRIELTFLSGLPIDELLNKVSRIPEESVIYYLTYVEEPNGNRFLPLDSLDKISQAASVPVYGWHELGMDHGIIGGDLQSIDPIIANASALALRVLHGEKPENVPVVEINPNSIQLDWRQLQRWGISESRIPAGALVRFKQPTLWQQHKWHIISAISLIIIEALLIAFLLVSRARQRRAEAERERFASLVEAEHKHLDEVVSNVPGLVWESRIGSDGKTRNAQFVSQHVEKMLGYTVEEWMSEPRFWLKIIPEEEREETLRQNDEVFKSGKDGVIQFRWLTKANELLWVEAHLSVIFDDNNVPVGLRGVTLDITDRKQAESSLRESEARFRMMANTAPMMVWMSGDDKLRTFFNRSWLEFTGRALEQELGDRWTESVHADDREQCLNSYHSAFDQRHSFRMEYRLRRFDGEYRWIFDEGVPRYKPDGRFAGYIGSCLDFTERKTAEEGLRNALVQVGQLKDQLQQENIYLREQVELEHQFQEIIGNSDEIKYVLFKIQQVAPTDASVLIQGETGTGKELVARAIHSASTRKDRPMVKINCAALPANLIESELFGHEKGAFTGAQAKKIGRFELAHNATLFLDEIGELPLELQSKLLRVLQEGEFERLGSSQTRKVDVRIIAATNRNLKAEMQNGLFREDLWYRLNVFPITVPPLRQRKSDIALLVNFFVNRSNRKLGKIVRTISPQTLQMLENYYWPGNVRELANVIERALINSNETVLRLADKLELDSPGNANGNGHQTPFWKLEDVERDHIVTILNSCEWRIEGTNGAAAILGINSSTLRSRMNKLGIKRPKPAALSKMQVQ